MSSITDRRYKTDTATSDKPYRISGHWNADFLYGQNGEIFSIAEINFHDNTFEHIKCYQFVQERPGNCTLLVVPIKKEFVEENRFRIYQRIKGKFGNALICDVQVVDNIQLTERGKYKMVIQNWKGIV